MLYARGIWRLVGIYYAYILGYIFGYILWWYICIYTVRQRQDKPHSVQDFACKFLHGFTGPPHIPGILPLPAIIPFLYIFGIISAFPGLIPALCPTAYYILWLPPPAGRPVTTHTPPKDPLGGIRHAGGRVTPLKNIPSQLPAWHAPFMFKLITNFRPCCANDCLP
jgi:hypothetical protein